MLNLENIERNLINLKRRIDNESNEKIMATLIYDYYSLLGVLDLINKDMYNKYNIQYDFCFNSMYDAFYKNSLETIINNKNSLYKLSENVEVLSYNRPRVYFGKKSHYNDFEVLVGNFWNDFNKDVLCDYNSIKENNIYFGTYEGISKGCCYNTFNDKESYLLLKEKSASSLSHEITHRCEYKNMNDFSSRVNYHYSTFRELLPRFVEFTFLNSLNDKKYDYYKYGELFNFFEGIKCCSEFYLEIIKKINGYDDNYYLNYGNKSLNKYRLDLFICDVLAVYLYHLYINDKKEFNLFIDEFLTNRGISDEKIWKLFNIDVVIDILKKETINYNRSVYLSKKR